jgi:hypothetical protein
MKRIRVHKPRVRREGLEFEVFPLDPRDADVRRAKALARAASGRRVETK